MSVERSNDLGQINISHEAIAALAGGVVTESYGVVGMASQKVLKDGLAELLKKENFSKGIVVRDDESGLELDLYIILGYRVKISEIVFEIQKNVKYVLEKSLDIKFKAINVFVQGVSSIG